MDDALMTVPEAARLARLGKSTMYVLAARGDIPVVRFGKSVRIRRATLLRWIESNEVGDIAERPA